MHIHAHPLSAPRACVFTYTRRARAHTPTRNRTEDEEGEFPSRWGRLQGRRALSLPVGRKRVRRRRRHRATQCRRNARPNDTTLAKRVFFAGRHISLGDPLDRKNSEEPVGNPSRRKKQAYEKGSGNLFLSRREKGREHTGVAAQPHRPGILSCHSSTPFKSYWCDGTLSSSWWSTSDRCLSSSCSRLTKRGTGCVECVSRSQIGVALVRRFSRSRREGKRKNR